MNWLYLAYCKEHGNTPEQQLEKDTEDWPGGKMCGYMLWVQGKRTEFFGQGRHNRVINEEQETNFKNWIQNGINP